MLLTPNTVLESCNLSISNCVVIGTDGASVMCGRHHSLFSLMKEENPKLILAKCICHSLHLACRGANSALPANIDFLVRKSLNWFSCSPNANSPEKSIFRSTSKKPTQASRHLGPMDAWSAFPFENHMLSLKKMLRKPEYSLEQLCNRLFEQGSILRGSQKGTSCPWFSAEHDSGPLIAPCKGPQFFKVTLPGNVVLAAGRKNSCCILADGSVIVVKKFAHLPYGATCVIGRKYFQCKDLHLFPCPSLLLGICVVDASIP